MEDIVLVTGEATRFDYREEMQYISSLDPIKGTSAGHYTRPSLSSIHSSSYAGAISTQPVEPTIGEVLNDSGYTCIGVTTNPQAQPGFGFDAGYEFYDNFVDQGTRGSKLREFVGRFSPIQRVYQRLFPMHDRRDNRPSDDEVVDIAVQQFNKADSPRFLWVHLMESHRPYGLGENGISPKLNRKAKFSPEKVTNKEKETITQAYTEAIRRVDSLTKELLDRIDSNPLFAFTGDHGELLGEHGAYFHPPHKQYLHKELIEVPVAFNNIEIEADKISLIDVAPTLLAAAGVDIPYDWHGYDVSSQQRDEFISWAPWLDTTSVLWQTSELEIQMQDAMASFESRSGGGQIEDVEKSEAVKERLRDFGYLE